MKKSQFKLNLLAVAFSTLIPLSSFAMNAQNSSSSPTGYLTDTSGKVVRSGTGLCWRTSADPLAGTDCDGVKQAEVMPAVVPKTTPVVQDPVVVTPSTNAVVKTISEVILFDFDSARIRPDQASKLDNIISSLGKDMGMYTLHLTGHADPVGTNKYNQSLSEKRAQAVAAYLKNKGVDSNLLHTMSKGEIEPIVSCSGKTPNVCNQPNRRVKIYSTTN